MQAIRKSEYDEIEKGPVFQLWITVYFRTRSGHFTGHYPRMFILPGISSWTAPLPRCIDVGYDVPSPTALDPLPVIEMWTEAEEAAHQ